MIYEVYRDAEAFKLHWDGASMKTVRTEMATAWSR
jgi:quinol monooxygenase YgiN